MTAEQQTALVHATFWTAMAHEEKDPEKKEAHVQRAIKNLMIGSHGR